MLGARIDYAVPRALARQGLLSTFFTDTYVGNKPLLHRVLKAVPSNWLPGAAVRLMGRANAELDPSKVVSFDRIGIGLSWRISRARSWREIWEITEQASTSFCRSVARAGLSGNAVYALNG